MDVTIDGLSLGAMVAGLTEMAKKLGLPSQFAPPLATVMGAGINCVNAFMLAWPGPVEPQQLWMAALNGGVVGLATAGLYAVGKRFLRGDPPSSFSSSRW